MNPSLNCDFDNLQKDQNGRIVSVDSSLSGSKFSLCNIYVPNDQRKQQEFLHDFSAYLMSNTDTERLIVGSLRSKRFRRVWEQRKTEERVFCLRGKWGESQKKNGGARGGEGRNRLRTNPWILKTPVRWRTGLVIGWASRTFLTCVDQRS